MKDTIRDAIADFFRDTYEIDVAAEWTVPDPKFGDLATNVALTQAKKLSVSPRELAEKVAQHILSVGLDNVGSVDVAGPGFINITLSNEYFSNLQQQDLEAPKVYDGKEVVTEFSDPNPFKPLHVGHLYTSIVGDALSRLISATGGEVIRLNFGGDVGLHVAKSMWGIQKKLGGFDYSKLQQVPQSERAQWLGARYVEGSTAYSDDESAQSEIQALNKAVYEIHSNNDTESEIAKVYWEAREWSYTYFKSFYTRLDVKFDEFIPESVNADAGLDLVKSHVEDGVYEYDDGAIIFRGEDHGLHNRVFVNSEGLPTYEAKDVGLAQYKWDTYAFDESVIITGNEIIEYMKVVKKSMESFMPDAVERTVHLTHGLIEIKGAGKMSSREGNVLLAEDVLTAIKSQVEGDDDEVKEKIMLAAVRYSFLKQRLGENIQFDISESVRTVGNSGPYLQYALVRAKSIIRKSTTVSEPSQTEGLEPDERLMLRELSQFTRIIEQAAKQHSPHLLCTYLYELAQTFNRFYENNHILNHERESIRFHILGLYVFVLEQGFEMLGIPVLDEM